MPRTVTKTVYTFQELLDLHAAGQVKREGHRPGPRMVAGMATDHDWYDVTFDSWKGA